MPARLKEPEKSHERKGRINEEKICRQGAREEQGTLEDVTDLIHGNPKHPFPNDAYNKGPADQDQT